MAKALEAIGVHLLSKTVVDRASVRRWLDELGATEFEIPAEEQVADPALLVALAAKQCYLSFQPGLNPNVNKVRSDMVEYLDNILKQAHGSVLEHAVFTFGINGCSRVFTGEMNRHRAGTAISERSMRYIKMNDLSFWMPEIFQPQIDDVQHIAHQRERSRQILIESFRFMEHQIAILNEIWGDELTGGSFHQKKQLTSAFRRIIGMGVATGGVWTMNVRALRHIIAARTSEGAEEEMIYVIGKIARVMLAILPELFPDFKESASGNFIPTYHKV